METKVERRNILLLIAGNSVSMLGTSVYLVALILYLAKNSASATTLGLVQFLAHLPGVMLAPLAGAVVDAVPRLRVIVWADLLRGVLLMIAGIWGLVHAHLPMVLIYAVVLLYGAGSAFFLPAVHALIPDIVSLRQVKQVNAWKQATQQTANLAGNAVGGALFAVFGAPLLFVVNGVSFCLSAISEALIRVDDGHARGPGRTPPGAARDAESVGLRVRAGMGYVVGHGGLRWLLVINAGIQLIAPPLVIALPFIVTRGLALGAATVGLAYAALLGGGVLGYTVTGWAPRIAEYPIMIGSLWLFGLAALVVGTWFDTALLFALLVITGGAVAAMQLVSHAQIQTRVPRFIRGRVYALWEMSGLIAAPLGYLAAGPLVDRLAGDFRPLFLAFGVLALTAGTALLLVRPLRRFFRFDTFFAR